MNFNFNRLPPFKWFVLQNFPFIEADFDSITYYQLLCKLGEEINKIIEQNNKIGIQVENLTNFYNQLQEYINNYFENLDVQEEIDNKLDEMAESGELAEIVEQFLKNDLKFYFPKFWANRYSGDCNLIKYKDINILIDCYGPDAWTDVKAFLDFYSVAHIDYFILTHYHADHVGNFENLVNSGYIDTNTIIYLPAPVQFWDNEPTYYTNFCNTNNLNYHVPTENEVLQIDDLLKLTFTNCDTTILNNYYNIDGMPQNLKQNNCSTVTLIEYQNTKALYTGDLHKQGLERIRKLNFVKSKIDLYKISHHGIDETTDLQFIRNIAPDYAVQTSGILHAQRNEFGCSADPSILESLGTNVYPCHKQTDYLEFVSNGEKMYCMQGKAGSVSTSNNPVEYYVDINVTADDIQDGSEQHPFKEISQAIGNLGSTPQGDVTIHVANGYYANGINYGTSDSASYLKNTAIAQRPHTINILGTSNQNTIINGLRFINANVRVRDVKIDTDNHNEAIYSLNSRVEFTNCNITSNTNTQHNKNATYFRKSQAYFDSCSFDYCNIGLNVLEASVVVTRYCNYGTNITTVIYNRGIVREWGTNQNTDITLPARKDYNKVNDYGTYYSPILIYAGEPEFSSTEIPLTFDIRKLNAVKIDFVDDEGVLKSTGIIDLSHSNRHWIGLDLQKQLNNVLKENGTCVQFRDGLAMYYQASFHKETNISNGTVTVLNTNRKLSVIRIYGYIFDYYNLTN